MARHGLWPYVVAPVVVNAALIVGTSALGLHVVRQRLGLGAPGASTLALIGLWVAAVIVGVVLFIVLQPLLAAPFVDALTERTEIIVRGEHPRIGVLLSAWRAVGHGLLKLVCYALALAAVLALSALTGVGGGLAAVAGALVLAYDGFDFPLARRGAGFRGKWKYLLLHPGQTMGYCVGATLLYLVPPAIVVAPAFAAVGATLAFLDSDPNTDAGPGRRAAVAPDNDDGGASSR